jgi:hypothetical protein
MFSLEHRVQPATMIGFKQIEFFDHTRSATDQMKAACEEKLMVDMNSKELSGSCYQHTG